MKQNSELLLRSMLYVPAYNKKFLNKVPDLNSDAVILDLEDSVPCPYKENARNNMREFLGNYNPDEKKLFVRLNSIESQMLFRDLECVLSEKIDGFFLTKIYSEADMFYYDKLISQYENDKGLNPRHFIFVPLIETASAVMDVYRIAKSTARIKALAFGGEDFLNDIGGFHGLPPKGLDAPRAQIVLAARSVGALPIDTPYLQVYDDAGFWAEERTSFEMGFAGVQCLHPRQIELANACFFPSEQEIRDSQNIVLSIEEAAARGTGVAMYNGNMIGPPMEKRAHKVLKLLEEARR